MIENYKKRKDKVEFAWANNKDTHVKLKSFNPETGEPILTVVGVTNVPHLDALIEDAERNISIRENDLELAKTHKENLIELRKDISAFEKENIKEEVKLKEE